MHAKVYLASLGIHGNRSGPTPVAGFACKKSGKNIILGQQGKKKVWPLRSQRVCVCNPVFPGFITKRGVWDHFECNGPKFPGSFTGGSVFFF
jgi:hypothetical protein